jgi:hypothetical protein
MLKHLSDQLLELVTVSQHSLVMIGQSGLWSRESGLGTTVFTVHAVPGCTRTYCTNPNSLYMILRFSLRSVVIIIHYFGPLGSAKLSFGYQLLTLNFKMPTLL